MTSAAAAAEEEPIGPLDERRRVYTYQMVDKVRGICKDLAASIQVGAFPGGGRWVLLPAQRSRWLRVLQRVHLGHCQAACRYDLCTAVNGRTTLNVEAVPLLRKRRRRFVTLPSALLPHKHDH